MQTLSRVRAGATPAITFLLTGSRDLHRVLDSPGMTGLRQFTRERFDLDRSLAWVRPGDRPGPAVRPPAPGQGVHLVASVATDDTPGKLIVMLDGAIIERRELTSGRLAIGRSPQSDLRLNSRYVSRHHAALLVTADGVTVVDLQSTNSTLVNGKAIARQRLEHGDLVSIGNFRVRYDRRRREECAQGRT
ncbi:MAG: FHA domain-containing protein [Chromatiales bacterium]|nr:FHA domain-containing protein [Chromatiales bacterium]